MDTILYEIRRAVNEGFGWEYRIGDLGPESLAL